MTFMLSFIKAQTFKRIALNVIRGADMKAL